MTFTIPTGFAEGPVSAIPRERRGMAYGLYCAAGLWASDNATAGFVPAFILDDLGFEEECAESLVDVGLWIRVAAGFRTAEAVARAAALTARGRAAGLASGRARAVGANQAERSRTSANVREQPRTRTASCSIEQPPARAPRARASLDFDLDLDLDFDLGLNPSQLQSQLRSSKDEDEIAGAISGDAKSSSPATGTDLELSSKIERHLTVVAQGQQNNRPEETQALLGEWIAACPTRPPGRVVGQVGREIRQMLREGIPLPTVRAGFVEWHERRLHPSALASVVHETSLGPPTSNGGRKSRQEIEHDYDAKLMDELMARAVAEDAADAAERALRAVAL